MRGIVVRSTGSQYDVLDEDGKTVVQCKVKGNFRLRGIRSTSPVAVGDMIDYDPAGFITNVYDRRNYIVRKSTNLSHQTHILAANIDLTLLVVTLHRPLTTTTFIDRYLASAEAYGVPAALVFNKCDDLNDDERLELQTMMSLYRSVGYGCYAVSALTGDGIQALKTSLCGKTTLLAGHSGAGKSTLLNSLVPSASQKTAEISAVHQTGQHTTAHSEMFHLSGTDSSSYIIDTPGIKGWGTFDFRDGEVSHYFPDIFKLGRQCRFYNCTHREEPGCAVVQAVESGDIALSRYTSYISILADSTNSRYR